MPHQPWLLLLRPPNRSLASDSLELLSAAIRHPELAPHLLHIQV